MKVEIHYVNEADAMRLSRVKSACGRRRFIVYGNGPTMTKHERSSYWPEVTCKKCLGFRQEHEERRRAECRQQRGQ